MFFIRSFEAMYQYVNEAITTLTAYVDAAIVTLNERITTEVITLNNTIETYRLLLNESIANAITNLTTYINEQLATKAAWTDRGNVAAFDFREGDFDIDGGNHELDLSGIVGAAERLVLLRFRGNCTEVFEYCYFETTGNTNHKNISIMYCKVAGKVEAQDIWVTTNTAGKISYLYSSNKWVTIYLTVAGYFTI